MFEALTILSCIGAGTVGGVFFAFSTFVMKALAQLPASQGVAAMRQINEVVLNSIFLGVFVGPALLAGGLSLASFLPWTAPRSPLLLAAGILYLAGSFFVTMRLNVPMNERLDSEPTQTTGYWPAYVREWSNWNHVRTVASLASAACSAASLAA